METIIAFNFSIIICLLLGVVTKKIANYIYKDGVELLVIGKIEINEFWFCLALFYIQTQVLGIFLACLAKP